MSLDLPDIWQKIAFHCHWSVPQIFLLSKPIHNAAYLGIDPWEEEGSKLRNLFLRGTGWYPIYRLLLHPHITKVVQSPLSDRERYGFLFLCIASLPYLGRSKEIYHPLLVRLPTLYEDMFKNLYVLLYEKDDVNRKFMYDLYQTRDYLKYCPGIKPPSLPEELFIVHFAYYHGDVILNKIMGDISTFTASGDREVYTSLTAVMDRIPRLVTKDIYTRLIKLAILFKKRGFPPHKIISKQKYQLLRELFLLMTKLDSKPLHCQYLETPLIHHTLTCFEYLKYNLKENDYWLRYSDHFFYITDFFVFDWIYDYHRKEKTNLYKKWLAQAPYFNKVTCFSYLALLIACVFFDLQTLLNFSSIVMENWRFPRKET